MKVLKVDNINNLNVAIRQLGATTIDAEIATPLSGSDLKRPEEWMMWESQQQIYDILLYCLGI
jgi:hypothetical protein